MLRMLTRASTRFVWLAYLVFCTPGSGPDSFLGAGVTPRRRLGWSSSSGAHLAAASPLPSTDTDSDSDSDLLPFSLVDPLSSDALTGSVPAAQSPPPSALSPPPPPPPPHLPPPTSPPPAASLQLNLQLQSIYLYSFSASALAAGVAAAAGVDASAVSVSVSDFPMSSQLMLTAARRHLSSASPSAAAVQRRVRFADCARL